MVSVVKKHITIGSAKVFLQVMGRGPALILMHPSPHSSDMLLPLAKRLSGHYTTICMDTPGYGKSDGLETNPENLEPYAAVLHELVEAMGIDKLALYGSATGAQIAIRYALNHPDKVSHLFLDNAAHFDEALRTKILAHYFPNLAPSKKGEHLYRLWDIVSHMFQYFPWCLKTPEYALNRPQIPTMAMHAIAMDYLNAGERYADAYRAAFIHERADYVQQLTTKTTVFKWLGSIILPYVEDLLHHKFPENVGTLVLEKDNEMRMSTMAEHMISQSSGIPSYQFPSALGEEAIEERLTDCNIVLPEPTSDGMYLANAWSLLYDQFPNESPEEIQKRLVYCYRKQNNQQ